MNDKQATFWKFLTDNKIEIPIIQRDYAQGRPDKVYLRRSFLTDLKNALDNKETEMHLDFVYGSTESENRNKMNPLDGQQRLTTLWLLHWYIALRAGQLESSGQTFKRFTYETRVSSRDFCEKLCDYKNFEEFDGKNIVDFIKNQTWFFSAWKQDPTIQAMLIMLGGTKDTDKYGNDIKDGIEEFFVCDDYNQERFEDDWGYLTGSECKIVFEYLNLPDFKLSDDLYIKMNARGKQLSSFENFKADLIRHIRKQAEDEKLLQPNEGKWEEFLNANDGIPVKLDTNWTDIFWDNRSSDNNRIDEIYFAFINRFFLNELIVYKNRDDKFLLSEDENSVSKNKLYESDGIDIQYNGFDDYYFDKEKKEIPIEVFYGLQKVLDAFSSIKGNIGNFEALLNPNWKDSEGNNNDRAFCFIPKYSSDNQITKLTQNQRVVFYAVCKYFEQDSYDETSFKRWIRVVWNLVENEGSMIGNIRFIKNELASHSHAIYEYLASLPYPYKGEKEQLNEEIAKANQILDDDKKNRRQYGVTGDDSSEEKYKTWEEIIIDAENYAFFKGAIRFLFLDDDGKVDWGSFYKKWENAKSLIPLNIENRHTIKRMIPFMADDVLKDVFNKFSSLSNKDDNLKSLFLDSFKGLHNFFMQQNKTETANLSSLQSDLIYLCEQHPDYWIHNNWVNVFDVLSKYAYRSGGYIIDSYVVVNKSFQDRLSILEGIDGIKISYNQENDKKLWKGLFIDFEYKGQKFRWWLYDWVDMYDGEMNNLWEKGLHSHYMGDEKESFNNADSLKNELERCCDEWSRLH